MIFYITYIYTYIQRIYIYIYIYPLSNSFIDDMSIVYHIYPMIFPLYSIDSNIYIVSFYGVIYIYNHTISYVLYFVITLWLFNIAMENGP